MIKKLDCIVCPMSCHLEVEMDGEHILSVNGNTCQRGDRFARSEVTCPMRMLTTTIRIHHALHPSLPVIISTNIPKTKIFDIMNICSTLEVHAPIQVGDIIVHNIAHTGADLLASRTMEMRNDSHESKNTSRHRGL